MMYRIHNTYPTGSKIVKGIKLVSNNPFLKIDKEKIKVYISSVLEPTKKNELNVDILQVDDDYYYTTPFYVYFTGEYIITWEYNEKVVLKQHITVSDRITDTEIKTESSIIKL